MKKIFSVVVLMAFLASVKIPLCAQQQNAQLSGSILDQSGAAVEGATITITDSGRGLTRTTTSDGRGEYTFALLPPGDHYVLTVKKAGFKSAVQQNLTLQIAQSATVNLTLSAGGESTTVTVNAEAPILETESSSQGQVISGDSVTGLPLNGRSTFRLIQLTPGVVFSNGAYGQFGDVAVNTTFDSNFRINGGRASANEFLIDGVPTATGFFDQITTDPMPDETQEFKVESTDLPAQYGRYAGGVVNVATKSGTNEIHGDAFEFLRNSVFDANDWFSNHVGKSIPIFRMNQFGGVLGGPVVFPKIYNGRGRTFFFGSYEGTRRAKGSSYTATVPTDAQKNGDFSGVGVNIFNPFNYNSTTGARTQFAGNKIPSNMFDPVALAIQKYFPEPNVPGAGLTNNYYHATPIVVNQDTYSGRIDRNVTDAYKLFGRYSISTTALTQPNQTGTIADAAGSVGTTYFRNQSFSLGNTFIISPKTLLSVSYGFARWHQLRTTLSYGFNNATLGFPASYVSGISIPMFPTVSIVGYMGTNGQSYFNNGNDSHAVVVQLSRVSGRNNLTIGADGRMHRINFFNSANPAGSFAFAQQQTRSNNVVTAGGNAYASFLLGFGNSGQITDSAGSALQDFYGAAYVQDNFRLSPKLTLNLGVRYDGETAYVDRHDQLNYFDPNVPSPARNPQFPNLTGGLVFADTNGTGRAIYTRDHLNIAPRVGFAWAPRNDLSIRAAYGLAYAPLELTTNGVGTVPNLGFGSITSWNTGQAVGSAGQVAVNLLRNPYPSGFVAPSGKSLGAATQLGQGLNGSNTSLWDHHPSTPYSEQWSFDIQQQFRDNSLLDMTYIGSVGVHLTSLRELDYLPAADLSYGSALNTLLPNPFAPFVTVGALSQPTVTQRQLLLPYPQFTSVQEVNSTFGVSTYNALSVKYVKHASRMLDILVSYTWSKEMSNVNGQDAAIGNTNQSTSAQDWGNLSAERSISDMDVPQNLVVSGHATLPFGSGKRFLNRSGIEDKFMGGWSFDPIWVEQMGFPLEMSVATTWGASRPNRVPGVSPKISEKRSNAQRVAEWYNTAAFTTPPAYTYGTERRTTSDVRKPGISNVDASLVKQTGIGERLKSQFRVDMFNVANSAHFAPPGMSVTTPSTYGIVSNVLTAPPEREIQFSLKLLF